MEISYVDGSLPEDELAVQLKDAVAVIANSRFTVDTARLAPNLKLVQVTSAGTDRLDLQGLGELGVRVANNGGGNAPSVAEHTISLMIAVYRKMHLQYEAARAGEWAGGRPGEVVPPGPRDHRQDRGHRRLRADRPAGRPATSGLGLQPRLLRHVRRPGGGGAAVQRHPPRPGRASEHLRHRDPARAPDQADPGG